MEIFPSTLLLLKSLHIIAVICWFAGLFYLPRLFIYHSQNKNNPEICKTFITMERKLYRYIMLPSMIATVVFGLWIVILYPSFMSEIWFHIKFLLVLFLIVFHFFCGHFKNQLADSSFNKSDKFLRFFNEIPTLILIVIVFLVVFKP